MTTFTAGPGIQTLPIWIFHNLFRPNHAPVVNVVACSLVLVSIFPVWLAQRLSDGDAAGVSPTRAPLIALGWVVHTLHPLGLRFF